MRFGKNKMKKLLRKFRKCRFCRSNKPNEKLVYVPHYGIYGEVSLMNEDIVHISCLKERLCNYERYSNKEVDLAICISDRIRNDVQRKKNLKESQMLSTKRNCDFISENF